MENATNGVNLPKTTDLKMEVENWVESRQKKPTNATIVGFSGVLSKYP